MEAHKPHQFILLIGGMDELQQSFNKRFNSEWYETTCIDLFKLIHDAPSLFSLIDILEQHIIGQDKVFFFMENDTYNTTELMWVKHIILTLVKVIKSEHINTKIIFYINNYKLLEDVSEFSVDNFTGYLEELIKGQKVDFQIISVGRYELEMLIDPK